MTEIITTKHSNINFSPAAVQKQKDNTVPGPELVRLLHKLVMQTCLPVLAEIAPSAFVTKAKSLKQQQKKL